MVHKVQYYETDRMGVTHHSNYVRWMEEARIELMDRMGFPYIKMEEEGIILLRPLNLNTDFNTHTAECTSGSCGKTTSLLYLDASEACA